MRFPLKNASVLYPRWIRSAASRVLGAAFFSAALLAADLFAQIPVPVVRSVKEFRALSPGQAKQGLRLDFQAVVVARFRPRNRIYVVDGSEVAPLIVSGTNANVEVGQRIAVRGTTAIINDSVHGLVEGLAPIGERGPAPPGEPVKIRDLHEQDLVYRWVNLKGMAQSVIFRNRNRMSLMLRDRGHKFLVNTRQLPDATADDLRYASLEVTGLVVASESAGSAGTRYLWADPENLQIVRKPPRNPFNRARQPISELLEYRESNRLPRKLTNVRARVGEAAEKGGVWLDDGTGKIRFLARRTLWLRTGDWIDVVGFLAREEDEIIMDSGAARILASALHEPDPPAPEDGQASNRVASVSSITELRKLDDDSLVKGWPVRLRALVSYVENNRRLFVRTAAGGVELNTTADYRAKPGEWALVDGYAKAGAHGPLIAVKTLESVDPPVSVAGLRMPPQKINQGGIMGKRYQSQWMIGDGNVRRVERGTNSLRLVLARTGLRFIAVLPRSEEGRLPTDLIGRRVQLTGVGDVIEGMDRRPRLKLLVPSLEEMSVSGSPLSDLADTPVIAITNLFDAGSGPWTRARHIEGIVTYREDHRLFMADDSGGVAVASDQVADVNVGDLVSAIGYPVIGGTHPFLEDALLQSLGRREAAPSEVVSAGRILYGRRHGELITVDGHLVSQTRSDEDYLVTLNDGLRVITAVLPFKEVSAQLINLAPQSELRLTGVCEYRHNHRGEIESYQLLLRSAEDLRLVAHAPWWTGDRLLIAIGGLLVVVLGSLGWVNFLRRRVEQTQGRFAAAFQASPVPVAIVTLAEFRFINVNESFLTQFEFRRSDVIRKTADEIDLFPSREKMDHLFEQLLTRCSVQDFEGEIRTNNGRELRVIISAEQIDLDGEECLLLLFQDVTERLNLMNQLRESQKMEAIGQLAAGVAHDFNNLLTIIRGNSELIGMMVDKNSNVAELNGEMDHAAARATDLTRQLLAFSRKQVMQKTAVDLNGIVVGSTKMLQRLLGEKISVRQELAPATVPLMADAGMLDQIIMNLAVNARDAMPGGGQLTLRTSALVYTEANLPSHAEARPGEFAVLEITDTGEGMSPETMKRIFEPFFTTKEIGKGTGLGLSTVYGIVRQHKGWIELDSELGRGTSFRFLLPAAAAEDLRIDLDDKSTVFFRGSEAVMVVEDEDAVRRMIQRTLAVSGYSVLAAPDGPSAQGIWATERGRIDLLITDLVMPNGLSGLDIAREFIAERPELAVILVSGYSADVIQSEGDLPPDTRFVSKPFTRDTLMAAVRQALSERKKGGELPGTTPARQPSPPQSARP